MALINALLASFRTDEEGQGLAEYALILALIAIVAIIALIFLGGQVSHDPVQRRQVDLATDPLQAEKAAGSSGGLRASAAAGNGSDRRLARLYAAR